MYYLSQGKSQKFKGLSPKITKNSKLIWVQTAISDFRQLNKLPWFHRGWLTDWTYISYLFRFSGASSRFRGTCFWCSLLIKKVGKEGKCYKIGTILTHGCSPGESRSTANRLNCCVLFFQPMEVCTLILTIISVNWRILMLYWYRKRF